MGIIGEALVLIRPETGAFGGEVNRAIQKPLEDIEKEGGKHLSAVEKIGKTAFLGLAGAAAGFGVAAVHAALEGEKAQANLERAVENTGASFKSIEGPLDAATKKFEAFGLSRAQVEAGLATLTTITQDPRKAFDLLGLSVDIAKAKNLDYNQSAQLVGQISQGNVRSLRSLIGTTKDASGATFTAAGALDELQKRFGGSAQREAETFAGKLEALRAKAENLAEEAGNRLVPVLDSVGGAIGGTIGFLEHGGAAASALAAAIAGPLVGAMGAFVVAEAAAGVSGFAETLLNAAIAVPVLSDELLGAAVSAEAFGLAIDSAAGPIGLVIGLIAAAGAAFFELSGSSAHASGEVKKFVQDAANNVPLLTTKLGELQAQDRSLTDQIKHGNFASDADPAFQRLAKTLEGVRANEKLVESAMKDTADSITAQNEIVTKSAPVLDEFAKSLDLTSTQVLDLAHSMGIDLQTAIAKNDPKLTEFFSKLETGVQDSRFASAATEDLAKAQEVLGEKFRSATDRASAFNTVLDEVFGRFTAIPEAEIAARKAIDDLTKALKTNGDTWDLNTKAGQDNQSALDATITGFGKVAEAVFRTTGSVDAANQTLQDNENALIATATQAGLTKTQIQELRDKFDLINQTFTATVVIPGLDQEIAQALSLLSLLKDIQGQHLNNQSLGGLLIPNHDLGGSLSPGLNIVGEKGPEFVNMASGGGQVVGREDSMRLVRAALSGGGGDVFNLGPFHITSNDPVAVRAAAKAGVDEAISELVTKARAR